MNNQEDRDNEKQEETSFSLSFQLEEKSELGDRIKEIVASDHVKAFARRCGVPESSIRSYILNQKRPGTDALINISFATGVTIDWLVMGRGIKYVKDLKEAKKMLEGAQPRASDLLPGMLEPYRSRLDTLHEYLTQISDEKDRSRIIEDIILRAEELKRVDELEHAVRELRAAFNKKTS
ncbi:MAG TPA: hypothetical protein PKD44_11595 [Nitrosomonas sp.]|nr:hypothetical protein [Nitrosomonas sp.]HNJ93002.1 hypothetical protein [Nitrosomonas sp.]